MFSGGSSGFGSELLVVRTAVNAAISESAAESWRKKQHVELERKYLAGLETFPRLEFFPGIDRKGIGGPAVWGRRLGFIAEIGRLAHRRPPVLAGGRAGLATGALGGGVSTRG